MKIISISKLEGIPLAHQDELFKAMKVCSNGQRLAVCLYFMSDLPDARHHLSDIERELVKIFPPSLRYDLSPKDYKDFQASTIRFLFNRETKDVREGSLDESHRLWTSPRRGHWRNTELGNRVARQVLRDRGLLIQKGDTVLNPADEVLPAIQRQYMEEDLALAAVEQEVTNELLTEPEFDEENLLAHVDRILSALPCVRFDKVPLASDGSISVIGHPHIVQSVIRQLADVFAASRIQLKLTLGKDEYQVEFRAEGSPLGEKGG